MKLEIIKPERTEKDKINSKAGRKRKYTKDFIRQIGKEMIDFMKKDGNYFLKEFAVKKGINAQRFSEFAKIDSEFRDSLQKAKDIQEVKLVRLGIDEGRNAAMVIFMLKNVAGYKDRTTLEHTGEELPEIRFMVRKGE